MTVILPTLRSDRQKGMDRLFFAAFREHARAPEVKRVERILSLLVSANADLERATIPISSRVRAEFIEEGRKRNEARSSYQATLDKLTKSLERYEWRSEIIGDLGGFGEELTWSDKVTAEMSVWEHAVVRMLLGLTNVPGEIARFRHCTECQDWFYAATSHQRFCGDTCRRRHTANSTEFKEKRRRYMQQTYRPQLKQRESESRALVMRIAVKGTKGK
jgi:hypothetical protein